jgi:hypothetical protein
MVCPSITHFVASMGKFPMISMSPPPAPSVAEKAGRLKKQISKQRTLNIENLNFQKA